MLHVLTQTQTLVEILQLQDMIKIKIKFAVKEVSSCL